jgi:pentatricopeptide repeat protein
VLNACANMVALKLETCRFSHEQICRNGWDSNIFVEINMVDMYTKCGSIEDARSVFNKMPYQNVVMVLGHVKCGQR